MIDARIPLMVQAPPVPDWLAQQTQISALRDKQQEQQITGMKLQMTRQAMQDQQIQRRAMADSGGNMDKYFANLQQYGASPDAIVSAQEGVAKAKNALLANDEAVNKDKLNRGLQVHALLTPVRDALANGDVQGAAAAFTQQYGSAVRNGLIKPDEDQNAQKLMGGQFSPEGFKLLDSQFGLGLTLLKQTQEAQAPKFMTAKEGESLINTQNGKPIYTAPEPKPKLTGDYQEFKETFYPGYLAENGLQPSAMNEYKALQEFKKKSRESKLLTPEEEIQKVRIAHASREPREPKETDNEKNYKYWQTLTTDANRRMSQENQKRIEFGEPAKSSPSGTELSKLETSPEGPGPRRWGSGQKMPRWLATQYFNLTKGDKTEAARMAQADGWDIRR